MSLRVAHKIFIGFGVVVLLMAGVGGFSLSRIADLHRLVVAVSDRDAEAAMLLNRVLATQSTMRTIQDYVVTSYYREKLGRDADEVEPLVREWEQARAQTDQFLDRIIGISNVGTARRAAWEDVTETAKAAKNVLAELSSRNQVVQRRVLNREASIGYDLDQTRTLREEFDQSIAKIAVQLDQVTALGRELSGELYSSIRTSMIAAILLMLVLAIVVGFYIQKSITTPLTNFMGFTDRVGKGELTERTDLVGSDEFGVLGRSLNGMVASLAEMAAQTRTTVENLGSASAQIEASAQEQNAGMNSQISAIQEITSTLEEITRSGAEIADRANSVASSAEATATGSQAGLRAVEATTEAMDLIRDQAEAVARNVVQLTEKTQAIGEIIATVNDIAERSNLLALNAAIEAAAAGEQGQSFSVVAEEMRNLAEQAKEATREVRTILGDIQQGISAAVMQTEQAVKRSEAGKQQTDSTEAAIRELVESVEESIQTFQQIVAATNQQQIGLEQVTEAVQNIRESSDQIATGARELSKAATNLNAMGVQLRTNAERYRV